MKARRSSIERVQANLVRLGVSVRVGSRVPAYCTALGHCILAHLPLERRMEILNARERLKLTPRTPVTIPEIEDRLQRVRKLGYALSDQDTVNGLRVLAAPILDSDGHPFAAVSVAAPSIVSTLEEFVSNAVRSSDARCGRARKAVQRVRIFGRRELVLSGNVSVWSKKMLKSFQGILPALQLPYREDSEHR